ncbi:DUF1534 domain-containing protein [Pseudomonas cannabina]|nr:DUF1534 domain-containing protein [Pseudomonas cannabina]
MTGDLEHLSFLTLQQTALRGAPRHRSAPRRRVKTGRGASKNASIRRVLFVLLKSGEHERTDRSESCGNVFQVFSCPYSRPERGFHKSTGCLDADDDCSLFRHCVEAACIESSWR